MERGRVMGKVRRIVLILGMAGLAGSALPLALAGPALAAGRRPEVGAVKRYQVTATVPAGTMPAGVAVNSRSGKVYVTNNGSSSVTVIKGSASAVVATVTVGPHPVFDAADPNNNRIYVGDDLGVSVINGRTDTLDPTFSIGPGNEGIGVDPATHTLYVAKLNLGEVLAIDTRTGAVTANIEVGRFPVGVAVNPATDTIYVANSIDDTISVINGKTNTVTTTIPVTGTPDQPAVNSTTGVVYSPEFNGDTISVIDGSTNTVTGTIHVTGLVAAAVIARTDTWFVTRQHEISVIDGSTSTKKQTVRVGRLPTGLGVNTSTGRLYVANSNGGNVSILSPIKGS